MNPFMKMRMANKAKGSMRAEGDVIWLYDGIASDDDEAEWWGGISPRQFIAALNATTGPVTLGGVPGITGAAASIADVKWAAAGGTLTGATINADRQMQIGHANQLTANVAYDRSFVEAPIVLGQNEGLVLQSDGAVVVGSTVILSLRWTEE